MERAPCELRHPYYLREPLTVVLTATLECNECPATLENVVVEFGAMSLDVRPRDDLPIWIETETKLGMGKLHFCSKECFRAYDARRRLAEVESPRVTIKKGT